MKKLVFATNSKHKMQEVQSIVGSAIELVSLSDISCYADIPETADTLEGNALLKARFVWDEYKLNCFGDDTGLEVKALKNAPGVLSARYAGDGKNSDDNITKILNELKGEADRSARFRTVIALIINGKEYLFEGIICGHLIEEKKGTGGFGYDPIFVPDKFDETFAELGSNVKNSISHRAIAANQLKVFLHEQFAI